MRLIRTALPVTLAFAATLGIGVLFHAGPLIETPPDGGVVRQAAIPDRSAPRARPTPSMPAAAPLVEFERELDPAHLPGAVAAPGALEVLPRVGVRRRTVEVGRGDTLLGLLVGAEVPREEAHGAIEALRAVYDPRALKPGQQVAVLFDQLGDARRFVGLELQPEVARTVSVSLTTEGFQAGAVEKELVRRSAAAEVRIESSLFEAGTRADVPVPALVAAIRAYSYDVDFQRDIQPGDEFRVLYEEFVTPEGEVARTGEVVFASLTVGGKELRIYRHETRDGLVDYYDPTGASVRKALLRTPVDGARISSGFGMRRHPILGYSKMHKGMDFAAPTGTPIYAAGDGIVEELGPKGAYGNYVRIRHNSQISTAYAHMSRFAKGAKRGIRVRQGDVIGYVGTTGRSTGPHLHYEVLKSGRQVNPLSVEVPSGRILEGRELQAFLAEAKGIDAEFARQIAARTAATAAR